MIKRLENYVRMKGNDKCDHDDKSNTDLLSGGAHAIVLGALKKVEAKSTVLISVIIFALAVTLGSMLTLEEGQNEKAKILAIFVISLVLPLLFSFRGMNQIDQRDMRTSCIVSKSGTGASRMQDALLDDLLKKERAFKFAKNCTRASVLGLAVLIACDAL